MKRENIYEFKEKTEHLNKMTYYYCTLFHTLKVIFTTVK